MLDFLDAPMPSGYHMACRLHMHDVNSYNFLTFVYKRQLPDRLRNSTYVIRISSSYILMYLSFPRFSGYRSGFLIRFASKIFLNISRSIANNDNRLSYPEYLWSLSNLQKRYNCDVCCRCLMLSAIYSLASFNGKMQRKACEKSRHDMRFLYSTDRASHFHHLPLNNKTHQICRFSKYSESLHAYSTTEPFFSVVQTMWTVYYPHAKCMQLFEILLSPIVDLKKDIAFAYYLMISPLFKKIPLENTLLWCYFCEETA